MVTTRARWRISFTTERAELIRRSIQLAADTHRLVEKNGALVAVTVISGGSRATYTITAMTESFDELPCGTYVTMGRRYAEMVPDLILPYPY